MHRVPVVEWKGNGQRGPVSYGMMSTFSKHYRHEAPTALHPLWKRRRSLWLSICIFFPVFVFCVSVLPAPMDDSENLETTPLDFLRRGLPLEKKSYALHESVDGLKKSRKEWQLKPDHFTLYNTSSLGSTAFNPLNLTNGIRVYVYDLPEKFNKDWLVDERCSNHLFASEVAIHKVLLSSSIKTLNPHEADFFYMPVYFSCKFSSKTGFPRLGHAPKLMEDAVNHVSSLMEFWNRSGGRDHVFVAAHDFGACFHSLESEAVAHGIPEIVKNSLILQTFGVLGFHPCQAAENIQIPPYISPSTVSLYTKNPPEQQRRNVFAFFRGKMEINPKNVSGMVYSRGVRTHIYKKFSRNRRFFLKRHRSNNYQLDLLRSTFCLCPLGWAPWSPRIVEAVAYGCVPVIIADNIRLPYSHTIDWSKISLKVREHDVNKLYKILLDVASKNLSSIQKNLWKEENRRSLLFMEPLEIGDATWHMLDRLSTKTYRSFVKHNNF